MANIKVMKIAYCGVNNITEKEADLPEHKVAINSALEDVWSYPKQYPGESREQMYQRLEFNGPANGEVVELAQHLKTIFTDIPKKTTGWATVYIVQKKLKELDGTDTPAKEEEVKEEQEQVATTAANADGDNNKNKNEKEPKNMGEQVKETIEKEHENMGEQVKETMENLEDLEKELPAGSQGGDIQTDEQLPAGDYKANLAASKKMIEDTTAERKAFVKNAVGVHIILAKEDMTKVCVDHEKAMGTVENVKKCFEAFVEKTGCVIHAEGGEPTFTHVPVASTADARKMYDVFMKLLEDNNYKLKPYFSKNSGKTIKGFMFKRTTDGEVEVKNVENMTTILLNESLGLLRFNNTVQLQIKKAKRSNTSSSKKGTGKAKDKSQNPYAGVSSIALTNREDAIAEFKVFWKEVTDKKDSLGGMKSDISVKYNKEAVDADGNPTTKTLTYRIPLKVEQYICKVSDPDMIKEIGEGTSSVGASTKFIDIDKDTDALQSLIADVAEATAKAAAKNIAAFSNVKKAAAEKQAESSKKEAEEIDAGGNL